MERVACASRACRPLILLQHIDFSDCVIENGGCADLAGVLKGMRGLTYINLSDTGVTQAGARALAAALQQHAQLQHVSLGGCIIGACSQRSPLCLRRISRFQLTRISFDSHFI